MLNMQESGDRTTDFAENINEQPNKLVELFSLADLFKLPEQFDHIMRSVFAHSAAVTIAGQIPKSPISTAYMAKINFRWNLTDGVLGIFNGMVAMIEAMEAKRHKMEKALFGGVAVATSANLLAWQGIATHAQNLIAHSALAPVFDGHAAILLLGPAAGAAAFSFSACMWASLITSAWQLKNAINKTQPFYLLKDRCIKYKKVCEELIPNPVFMPKTPGNKDIKKNMLYVYISESDGTLGYCYRNNENEVVHEWLAHNPREYFNGIKNTLGDSFDYKSTHEIAHNELHGPLKTEILADATSYTAQLKPKNAEELAKLEREKYYLKRQALAIAKVHNVNIQKELNAGKQTDDNSSDDINDVASMLKSYGVLAHNEDLGDATLQERNLVARLERKQQEKVIDKTLSVITWGFAAVGMTLLACAIFCPPLTIPGLICTAISGALKLYEIARAQDENENEVARKHKFEKVEEKLLSETNIPNFNELKNITYFSFDEMKKMKIAYENLRDDPTKKNVDEQEFYSEFHLLDSNTRTAQLEQALQRRIENEIIKEVLHSEMEVDQAFGEAFHHAGTIAVAEGSNPGITTIPKEKDTKPLITDADLDYIKATTPDPDVYLLSEADRQRIINKSCNSAYARSCEKKKAEEQSKDEYKEPVVHTWCRI